MHNQTIDETMVGLEDSSPADQFELPDTNYDPLAEIALELEEQAKNRDVNKLIGTDSKSVTEITKEQIAIIRNNVSKLTGIVWFDGKGYWYIDTNTGKYVTGAESVIRRKLRRLDAERIEGLVEEAIGYIQEAQRIDGTIEECFQPVGLVPQDENADGKVNKRNLQISAYRVRAPKKGSVNLFLRTILRMMGGEQARHYTYGLALAYEAAYKLQKRPSRLIHFQGPAGSYKSTWVDTVIRDLFGGDQFSVAEFFKGDTGKFNGRETAAATAIADEYTVENRIEHTAKMANWVITRRKRMEDKYGHATMIRAYPFTHACSNSTGPTTSILPVLHEQNRDKFAIFRLNEVRGDVDWNALCDSMPAVGYWLLELAKKKKPKDFKHARHTIVLPRCQADFRYGHSTFHNKLCFEAVGATDPNEHIVEAIQMYQSAAGWIPSVTVKTKAGALLSEISAYPHIKPLLVGLTAERFGKHLTAIGDGSRSWIKACISGNNKFYELSLAP